MRVSPRSLVLDILSAAPEEVIEVRLLVLTAGLFGINENNLRVALTRLRAEGKIESGRRGSYKLGPAARAVNTQVASWREVEDRVRPWDGAWLAVHTAGLSRARHTEVRRRARALELFGFRELRAGLEVRPDNLRGSVGSIRDRLQALALEPEAPVFRLTDLDTETDAACRKLWDTRSLEAAYRKTRRALARLDRRIGDMPTPWAAREAFLLGGQAIRQIVLDPLLPAPIVDEVERRAFVEEMVAFDRHGRRLWSELMGLAETPADLHGIDRMQAELVCG